MASREELLRHLEAVSGRRMRTPADVAAYVEETRAPERGEAPRRAWQTAKTVTLIALAGFAFLQYYALDVFVQIVSLPHLTVFIEAGAKVL